jgi:hypothetical protein
MAICEIHGREFGIFDSCPNCAETRRLQDKEDRRHGELIKSQQALRAEARQLQEDEDRRHDELIRTQEALAELERERIAQAAEAARQAADAAATAEYLQEEQVELTRIRLEEERAHRALEAKRQALRTGLAEFSRDFQQRWLTINQRRRVLHDMRRTHGEFMEESAASIERLGREIAARDESSSAALARTFESWVAADAVRGFPFGAYLKDSQSWNDVQDAYRNLLHDAECKDLAAELPLTTPKSLSTLPELRIVVRDVAGTIERLPGEAPGAGAAVFAAAMLLFLGLLIVATAPWARIWFGILLTFAAALPIAYFQWVAMSRRAHRRGRARVADRAADLRRSVAALLTALGNAGGGTAGWSELDRAILDILRKDFFAQSAGIAGDPEGARLRAKLSEVRAAVASAKVEFEKATADHEQIEMYFAHMERQILATGRDIVDGLRMPGHTIALVSCPGCGGPVGGGTSSCPYCGRPLD